MWFNMQQRLSLYCAIVCILGTFCPVQSQVVRYQEELYGNHGISSGNYGISGGNITCKCGNLKTVAKEINRKIMYDIIKGNVELESCSEMFPEDVCYLLSSCKSCTVHGEKCEKKTPSEKTEKKHSISKCKKEFYELENHYFGNQEPLNTTTGEDSNHRVERAPTVCGYPRNLRTSDVSCRTSPFDVACVQKCIRGYTLPQGKVLKLKCSKRTNRWKPSAFRECLPFVDCTLRLVSPGTLDCYTATTRTPAMCYVKCGRYEDKRGVPRRAYECLITKWSKVLPFCVRRGSGMNLVHGG